MVFMGTPCNTVNRQKKKHAHKDFTNTSFQMQILMLSTPGITLQQEFVYHIPVAQDADYAGHRKTMYPIRSGMVNIPFQARSGNE
jgi:hypothetical protein